MNDGIDRRSSMLRSGRHRRGSSAAVVAAEKEKARKRASTLEGSGDAAEKDEEGGMNVDEEVEEKGVEEKKVEKKVPARKEVSDEMMEDLVGGISALKFVPPSVRFGRGRGKGRGGFSRS